MRRQLLVGPSFLELRRTKERAHQAADGFPVFPRLADILSGQSVPDDLSPGTTFDREAVARYVCSVLSCWAYADLDDVAMIMTRLGLEKCRCRSIEISNNGALIRSTAYLVQSDCGRVALLAYRGTDPFDISTWAVSGDLNPATVRVDTRGGDVGKPEGETSESAATDAQRSLLQRIPLLGPLLRGVAGAADTTVEGAQKLRAGLETSVERSRSPLTQRIAKEAGRAVDALRGTASTGEGIVGVGTDVLRGVADAVFTPRTADEAEAAGASVHAGFYRNQRATWFEIADALYSATSAGSIFVAGERHRTWYGADESIAKAPVDQSLAHLYITGHSLGAAMALLAGYRIARDNAYAKIAGALRHIHAFAPPMVGNEAFARAFDERLAGRASCYAYKRDVVPHLPPKLKGSLGFVHVGKFYQVPEAQAHKPANECSWEAVKDGAPARAESAGQLLLAFDASFGDQVSLSSALLSMLRRPALERLTQGFFGSLIEPRQFAIYDHFPTHYEACSQLANRTHRTELGNDY